MKTGDFLILILLISSSLCLDKTYNTRRHNRELKSNSRFKEEKDSCLKPQFPTEEKFLFLLETLKGKTPDESIQILPELLKKGNGEMLSPSQTVTVFKSVNFGHHLHDAILKIRKYIWLGTLDLLKLLRKTRSLQHRKLFIELLYPILLDRSEVNLEDIEGQLGCNDKKIMRELIRKYPHPRDCFFGDLSGDTVFVIDLSGSMGFRFNMKFNGRTNYLTRLDFVKLLFKRAISSLSEDQKIQIIIFGTKAQYFYGDENDFYDLTERHKKMFIEKVEALQPGHGKDRYTNISDALELAFKIKRNYNRIIFFSDGGPTRGIWRIDQLEDAIKRYQSKREKNGFNRVPINVNLLMLGGSESKGFREVAKKYTRMIASSTGGVVKNFDSKVKK